MYRIVVPLDGSEVSQRAVGLGCMLTEALHGRLELVTALEEPVMVDLFPSLMLPDRQSAETYLTNVVKRLPCGIPATTAAIRGNPVDTILAYAAEEPDTLIAMSTHGRTGMSRMLFGSVTDKVVRGANCPVALARGVEVDRGWKAGRILVPLDGSELAETALPLATALAGRQGRELYLLRVVQSVWTAPYVAYSPQPLYLDPVAVNAMTQQAQEEANVYLDTLAKRLRADDVLVTSEVTVGRPADEIVRVAGNVHADAIVLTSHGRGGFRRWALGSVADEVLHREQVPMIVVPPPDHVNARSPIDASTTVA